MNDWLSARLAAARSAEERQILQQFSAEARSYYLKLDGLAARTGGLATPLDRDTVVMFDDSANRLQSMADDFAAVHDADLRALAARTRSPRCGGCGTSSSSASPC